MFMLNLGHFYQNKASQRGTKGLYWTDLSLGTSTWNADNKENKAVIVCVVTINP